MKTQSQIIREMIAESGKMTISDCVSYVQRKRPDIPKKAIQIEAKDLLSHLK